QRSGPQDSQQTQPDSPENGASGTPQQLPVDQPYVGGVGGLPTTIMQPGRAAEVAQAVQSANAKAQDDVKSIASALTAISNSLHSTTQRLERAVEGTYA